MFFFVPNIHNNKIFRSLNEDILKKIFGIILPVVIFLLVITTDIFNSNRNAAVKKKYTLFGEEALPFRGMFTLTIS
jgi:hypothetical protein